MLVSNKNKSITLFKKYIICSFFTVLLIQIAHPHTITTLRLFIIMIIVYNITAKYSFIIFISISMLFA